MPLTYTLNDHTVLIELTEDDAAILGQGPKRIGTGEIAQVPFVTAEYSGKFAVGDNVAFSLDNGFVFKDVDAGETFFVIHESYIYFSYTADALP
jgi:hypothetical protein